MHYSHSQLTAFYTKERIVWLDFTALTVTKKPLVKTEKENAYLYSFSQHFLEYCNVYISFMMMMMMSLIAYSHFFWLLHMFGSKAAGRPWWNTPMRLKKLDSDLATPETCKALRDIPELILTATVFNKVLSCFCRQYFNVQWGWVSAKRRQKKTRHFKIFLISWRNEIILRWMKSNTEKKRETKLGAGVR